MSNAKERPILFSAPMVRAILDGRKTQTRRIVKPSKDLSFGCVLQPNQLAGEINNGSFCNSFYGKPGDKLWVRETWGVVSYWIDDNGDIRKWKPDRPANPISELPFGKGYYSGHTIYRADGEFDWFNDYGDEKSAWKPSIHMPRPASRINLEITGIRIESLHDISEQDALAEGAKRFDGIPVGTPRPYRNEPDRWSMENPPDTDHCLSTAKWAFVNFFEKINGAGSWDKNPWVWVIEFKRV